jgi:competence protein ComGF
MKNHVALPCFVFILAIVILCSCSEPFDSVKSKTWEGEIFRKNDNKELSDVKFKMSNDTLFLFSNAIFGSENDTLILLKFVENDLTFTYKSLNENTFSFKLIHEVDSESENLYFIGNDYYIVLEVSDLDLKDSGSLSFYEDRAVPRESFMYLDGAYEGKVEMENQLSNYLLAEMGGVSMKLVFIDGFKVKIYIKSLLADMFSGTDKATYDIVNYKITGNTLYLERNKSKAQTIEVKNQGETLVLATDDTNIVMYKIY